MVAMSTRTYVLVFSPEAGWSSERKPSPLTGELRPASAASAASRVGTVAKPAGNSCKTCVRRRWVSPREDPSLWRANAAAARRRLPDGSGLTFTHTSGNGDATPACFPSGAPMRHRAGSQPPADHSIVWQRGARSTGCVLPADDEGVCSFVQRSSDHPSVPESSALRSLSLVLVCAMMGACEWRGRGRGCRCRGGKGTLRGDGPG
jgi:hypothetical protein